MPAPASKRHAVFIAVLSLFAASALAEPPRHDAPKMRNAPRASTALTLSQSAEAKPAAPARPTAVGAAQVGAAQADAAQADAAQVDAAQVDRSVKDATGVLELCYELARRSDPSLKPPVSVHATVRADGSVELRAQTESLGNGYFGRCVERKLSAIALVAKLPEPAPAARMIVLGATPPTR